MKTPRFLSIALAAQIAGLWAMTLQAQEFALSNPMPSATGAVLPKTSFVELGLLGLSRRSAEFGRYNGLGDGGIFALIDGQIRLRDRWNSDGLRYFDLDLSQLGLDNRRAVLRFGHQGDDEWRAGFDQFTRTGASGFGSVFSGTGSTLLRLPNDWVGAARSGDFSALSKRFGALDLSVERKRAHVTYTKRLALDLEARLGFSHEHRDGLRATSMSFGADANVAVATYFAQPIDQDNDRLEASLAHVSRRGQWSVHYTGSFFTDHLAGTMVQNPFTGTGLTPFLPAVSYPNGYGFLSSPPSSTAHQLAFDGGLPLFTRARLTTHLGFGLEQQNDPFAGYSINPGLAITTPLPRSTLGGLVYKTLARLSLTANLGDGFDLDASASFDARDNRTPRATYLYLVSDSQIQPNPRLPFNSQNARINAPYSWQKQLAHLALHYRLAPDLKLSLGYDFDDRTRSYQAVRRTTEQTGKLRLFYTFAWGDAALSTAYGHRHAGRYIGNQIFFTTRPTVVTTQFNSDVIVDHPLARKYDLVDRTRQNIEGHINLDPVAYAGLGLGGTLGRDDYDQSVYGLKRADRNRLDVDLHLRLGAGVKLSGFVALETHRSLQANYYLGGATLSNPDQVWQARNRDTSDIVGGQMDWTTALDGLAVKASVERMWTRSRIDVSAGSFTAASVVAPLPDVTAKSLKLRVHADYQLNADLALRGTYGFDRLAARDWAYLEADPLAYASLLGSGIRAPHYNIHQIGASLRYGF